MDLHMTAATGSSPILPTDGSLSQAVVHVDHLNHYFGDGPTKKQALFDCCLKVDPGQLVIMTGPSGSGKTTLLTLIGALRSTQEGSNRVLGHELRGLAPTQLVKIRREIGFIFQMHNLFESLSSLENVRMSMELRNYSPQEMLRLATEMLTRLGLGHRVQYKPRQMSGGQRQRVAIARALVNRPQLVLADEPTAALDKKSSRDVVEMLQALTREENATILMVTHDSRILDVADRIVNFVDGRIESDVIVNDTIKICETLKKSDVFQRLNPAELLNIAQKMQREQFAKGDLIFRQGEEGDKFYLILDGEVDVLIQGPGEQDPRVVNHLLSGAFFGEKALLSGEPRSASIAATASSTLYSLGKTDFQNALDASGTFNDQLRKVAFQR
jgi:putative ABC transport system ATP-binding protein